jgi:DNA-directed RNA polymerase subunit RPC12/RpoP
MPMTDTRMSDGTYRVRCMNCGKSVSNAMPFDIIVRAWVICPECIERDGVEGRTLTPDTIAAAKRKGA